MIRNEAQAGLAAQEGENMLIYCAVTLDRYEHITAMADNGADLARAIGVPPATLRSCLSRGCNCRGYKIERVEIDDEGEN